MSKKVTSLLIILTMGFPFLQGCMGKAANPISAYQSYDEDMSCKSIIASMHDIDENVKRLLPKSNKTGKNVALGVAGAVVFWPALLFMDFSNAEKVEIQAYQKRYERLTKLYDENHCSKKRKNNRS